MLDSSNLLYHVNALRSRFESDGYLFLRDFIPKRAIYRARKAIADVLEKENFLAKGSNLMDAVCRDPSVSPGLLNRPDVAKIDSVRNVLEHKYFFDLVEQLYGQEAGVVEYKWLRAVCYNKFTGLHVDRVYMGSYSDRLITAWIPLGDTPVSQGTLLVAPGSHKSKKFAKLRKEYSHGSVGSDGVQSGWIDDNAARFEERFGLQGTQWVTADFNAGDVCIINLDIFHISTANTTDRYRISCDVRFQPLSDPVNPLFTLRKN